MNIVYIPRPFLYSPTPNVDHQRETSIVSEFILLSIHGAVNTWSPKTAVFSRILNRVLLIGF